MLIEIALQIYYIIHSLFSFAGCFFNLFLVYLTLYRTPKIIKSYSTLVLNFAVADFFSCLTEYTVQQRIIPIGHTLAYISNGPCTYLGPHVCYTLYSVMLHFLSHSLWSLLLSFSYRYYILFHPAPKKYTIRIILLLIYIPSVFQAIIYLWAYDDPVIITTILKENFPDYNLDDKIITGNLNTSNFCAIFPTLHMVLPISPVYTAILILRRKILQTLERRSDMMAVHTKHMHDQLLKALTYQAILPFFYLTAVVSYALGQLNIIHHPVVESFVACILFIPVLTPVSSLIFVKPYRDFILKLCGRKVSSSIRLRLRPSVTNKATISSHAWG